MNKRRLYWEFLWDAPVLMVLSIFMYSAFQVALLLIFANVNYIDGRQEVFAVSVYGGFLIVLLTVLNCCAIVRKRKHYMVYYVAGASYKQLIRFLTTKYYLLVFLSFWIAWYAVECLAEHWNLFFSLQYYHYGFALLFCYVMNFMITSLSIFAIQKMNPFCERWEF